MANFEKGRAKTGGRTRGSRNKLSAAFLQEMTEDFAKHGAKAIRVARMEHPEAYLKVIASLMPKEFEIKDSRLAELSDDELDMFLAFAQRQLVSRAERSESVN